jgi:AraC-like DNA-binding protein
MGSDIGIVNPSESSGIPARDWRIGRLLLYLDNTPHANLIDCCRYIGLSRSRLLHLFKACTGMLLRTYLRRRRMICAAELLATTFHPIKTIAYTVGYKHTSSFARAFAAEYGIPAVLYRLRKSDVEITTMRPCLVSQHKTRPPDPGCKPAPSGEDTTKATTRWTGSFGQPERKRPMRIAL